jgi:hypothetical protein
VHPALHVLSGSLRIYFFTLSTHNCTSSRTVIISTGTPQHLISGLREAARIGDLVKVQRLIKEGANVHGVDAVGRNVLMHAVIGDHAAVVLWLLKETGAHISDVNALDCCR